MGIDLAHRSGLVEFEGGGYSNLAWVKLAQAEVAAARDALRRAQSLLAQPGVQAATRTYNLAHAVLVALGAGDLDGAVRVAQRFPTTPQEAGSFHDFLFVELVRSRLLLARDQGEAAAAALTRVCETADHAGWRHLGIQARALLAVATPSTEEALGHVRVALELAEPEGYVRTFLDGGEPMGALLGEAVSQGIVRGYAARLVSVFARSAPGVQGERRSWPGAKPSPLIESLSDRGLEVLRLLADGLTYHEIAQALYLSINTVKTHIRNIYGKLGVSRRRAAVARAQALGLLV